jgi:hypothetical protein
MVQFRQGSVLLRVQFRQGSVLLRVQFRQGSVLLRADNITESDSSLNKSGSHTIADNITESDDKHQ